MTLFCAGFATATLAMCLGVLLYCCICDYGNRRTEDDAIRKVNRDARREARKGREFHFPAE